MPPSATLAIALSLPSLKQLEAGDFDLEELSKKLAEALVNESQRNEIMQLTGDIAVLLIECLDKVSEIISSSSMASPYCAIGHVVQELQKQFRCSNTL